MRSPASRWWAGIGENYQQLKCLCKHWQAVEDLTIIGSVISSPAVLGGTFGLY